MDKFRLCELNLESWADFSRLSELLSRYIFRGQSDTSWGLTTSLERTQSRFVKSLAPSVGDERWALHEFKSKFHLYNDHAPGDADQFEWLAIMQHHGCPTRLLDFTWSIYVALHFAIANATGPAAIWCLNDREIMGGLRRRFDLGYQLGHVLKDAINQHHKKFFNELFTHNKNREVEPHLIPLESVKLSTRVARQQALFLAPTTIGDLSKSVTFEQCLLSSVSEGEFQYIQLQSVDLAEVLVAARQVAPAFSCLKLTLGERLQNHAWRQLESMGITEETLFPGLDGLARSLVMKHMRLI